MRSSIKSSSIPYQELSTNNYNDNYAVEVSSGSDDEEKNFDEHKSPQSLSENKSVSKNVSRSRDILSLETFNMQTKQPTSRRKESTNPFDEDVDEALDGNEVFDAEDPGDGYHPRDKRPLAYLSLFDESELRALEDHYASSRHQLDDLVKQYHWIYRTRRIEYTLSVGTDVAYTPFQLVTGSDGVEGIAQLVKSDIHVSNTVGLAIGTPMALMDLAFNLSAVSPAKEALKSTLNYAMQDPLRERFQEAYLKAQENKGEAFIEALTWSFNKVTLYSHNIIGASANFLPFYEAIPFTLPIFGDVTIPAWMPLLPKTGQFAIAATFMYGGNRYYGLFSNPDYYQNFRDFWVKGLDDLWNNNPDGQPWLMGEVRRGEIAIPLQIALQGLVSTVAMRAYPNFYYIAVSTFEKLFELGPDAASGLAAAISALVAWHTLCARYPRTYNRYMADHIKIETLLLKKFEDTVGIVMEQAVEKQMNSLGAAVDPRTLDQRKQELNQAVQHEFMTANRKLLEDQIIEANGRFYPFKKDKSIAPQMAYRAAVGAYLGYHSVTPLLLQKVANEPYSMTTLSLLTSASALAGALWFAEKNRVRNHLILEQLEPTLVQEKEEPSRASKLSNAVADSITVSSNASRALSTLGSAKRMVGGNAALMGGIAIFAFEQMINTILFTAGKIRNTVKDWKCLQHRSSKLVKVTGNTVALFNNSRPVDTARAPLDNQLANIPREEPSLQHSRSLKG